MFKNKNVVLGISGGIAAYKCAELVRLLVKRGAAVYCVLTRSAQEFITPLTLRTLSQNPVFYDMFTEQRLSNVEHIALADRADLFIVAPATANLLGKVANGIADDLLTTSLMATRAPVLFAPAMNVNMYENPIVQDNIRKLQGLGYNFAEPEEGDLACGYQGRGRLAEIEVIMALAEELLAAEKPLMGRKVLVSAGPTREPFDPVRYISNYSTGKMGYALARQARLLGAQVTLVSGPTYLSKPPGVNLIQIETALQMRDAFMRCYAEADIIIKAAAVADYRPKLKAKDKIKKKDGDLSLELERNPDILAELGQQKGERVLIGFAAETQDVLANATEKIRKKNLDFIAANDLTQPGAGFGCDTNVVNLLFANGERQELSQMSKEEVAREILLAAAKILEQRSMGR